MKINETKKSGLNLARQGAAISKRQVAVGKQHINALNVKDEEAEQDENGGVDPKQFMSSMEKRQWDRLSPRKKRKYIEMGLKAQKKDGSLKSDQQEILKQGFDTPLYAKPGHKHTLERSGTNRQKEFRNETNEEVFGKSKSASNHRNSSSYQGTGGGSLNYRGEPVNRGTEKKYRAGPGSTTSRVNGTADGMGGSAASGGKALQGGGRVAVSGSKGAASGTKAAASGTKLGGTAAKAGGTAAKAGGTSAAGAATGGAAVGATLAADGAKKAANKFKDALQMKAEAQSESIKAAQVKAQEEMASDSSQSALEKAGSAIVAVASPVLLVMVQLTVSIMSALITILIPIIIIAMLVIIVVALLSVIFGTVEEQNYGQEIVDVAMTELANSAQNVGGGKYKEWYGMDDNWCAMFVAWCANECGYIEDNVMPMTASVAVSMEWYIDNNLWQPKESGYQPKAGDIIHFKDEGASHVGIVIEYDAEYDLVTTIEGNSGSSATDPYHAGSRVSKQMYMRNAGRITGYGTPNYPMGNPGAAPLSEGESIDIPAGLGSVHTYMGWSLVTSTSSAQFKLRSDAGENYDSEGFAKIGTRYVIACTTTYGVVGDYVDFYQADGSVIECIIGDIKNQDDPGCNMWGHQDGTCIIEFVVDRNTWYGTGHPNPGTMLCHPEWNQTKIKAVNRGSYWGN